MTLLLKNGNNKQLFKIFINAVRSNSKYKKDLECPQLRITYTIFFIYDLELMK